jgi:hypothetical protein
MRSHLPTRFFLFLAAGLLAGSAALAQQKHRLRDVASAGDLAAIESNMDMSLTIRSMANGQEGPSFSFENRETEQYTEEVLSVSKGDATGVRRSYTLAGSLETEPSGEKKVNVSPLQGKTVTIRRKGSQVDVTAAEGELDDKTRKDLRFALDNHGRRFFPDRDVTPGDEWTVDPKVAARLFDGAEQAVLRGSFVEVVEHQGLRCARVRVNIDVSIREEGAPGPIRMNLEGDLYHALDLNRVLSLDVSGPVLMEGKIEEDGVVVELRGRGTTRMRVTQKWLKVGGKAVPGAAAE